MKHKYIIKINTICKECNFLNKGTYTLDTDMDVICCGKCGNFIATPQEMPEEDKEAIQLCIQQTIKENQVSKKENL